MFWILFIVFIIIAVKILLTDKTSPFYSSTIATGVHTANVNANNNLYLKYETQEKAEQSATLLMKVYDSLDTKSSNKLMIYRANSGEIVLVDHLHKLATTSDFVFDVCKLDNDSYTYHPEKVVYTGATVGGIHTGGIHTEEAHYTQGKTYSGKGSVFCNYAKNMPYFLVMRVKLSKPLLDKAKQNANIKEFLDSNGYLIPLNCGGGRDSLNTALHTANKYDALSMYSRSATDKYLPMDVATKIATWLTNAAKCTI